MTNADLKRKYSAVFDYHFLANIAGRTMLAGTYKKPGTTTELFAYVPAIDDFAKIKDENIVCLIRGFIKK